MPARTGEQFLQGLQSTKRDLWLEGEKIDDVTTDPRLSGAATSLAGVFDHQHDNAEICLVDDPETGEAINISHMMPRSKDDLWKRMEGLTSISEYSAGLMGRTPDYMNMKFSAMAARADLYEGDNKNNLDGAQNLRDFQKRLARDDLSLTHTIIPPSIDKRTDGNFDHRKVNIHKVAETSDTITIRGSKVLATLAPYADEIAVYPSLPIPKEFENYALSFAIPVDSPGLKFICRDSYSAQDDHFEHPISSRFDEQDAFVIFDDIEIPKDKFFLDGRPGSIEIYNKVKSVELTTHMTTQSTIRALTKLEFSYGLATRMAETLGDYSPNTQMMLGELLSYVEVARSALICSVEEAYEGDSGIWFPNGRSLVPLRSLLATWFPRVNEIIEMIGAHNLLTTPSKKMLNDPDSRALIEEFLTGADDVDGEERAALFRLAWDYIGSGLGGRGQLYERFYLLSASRNRMIAHLSNSDRKRAYGLVDKMLRK